MAGINPHLHCVYMHDGYSIDHSSRLKHIIYFGKAHMHQSDNVQM